MSTVAVAATPFPLTLPSVSPATNTHDAWTSIVSGLDDARLPHAAEWSTVIERAYGHTPLYLTGEDSDGRVGALPAFIVRRPFFGTVVASMPFLDGGGPCSASPLVSRLLVERLIAEAGRLRARFVDLRCVEPLSIGVTPSTAKVNMALQLPEGADNLWSGFDKSVRNQIRKAERSGLSIAFGHDELLASFHRIYVERMRDLGSPAHGIEFFQAVLHAFGSRSRVVLVTKQGAAVGGLIALAFKRDLTVPWAACSRDSFALCPNMLLYWETIRTACAEGFTRFDFGRSTKQSGTYRFKRQWGAAEEQLFWYRIPVVSAADPAGEAGRSGVLAAGMWRRLPASLTGRLGPRIRKYLIQ